MNSASATESQLSTERRKVMVASIQTIAEDVFGSADAQAAISDNVDAVVSAVTTSATYERVDIVVLAQGALQGRLPIGLSTAEIRSGLIAVNGAPVARLAELAATVDAYVAFGIYEADGAADEQFYSSAIIVGPGGERLHYRQMSMDRATDRPTTSQPSSDLVDDARQLFPTLQTRHGRIGCMVGGDVDGYEVPKALVFSGAELLLHPSQALPTWRRESRRQALRARAYESLCTIASTSLAEPSQSGAGSSAIIDGTGRIVAEAAHTGAGSIVGALDLEQLRAKRRKTSMNFPVQTRTDLYARGFNWVAAGQ